MSINIPISFYFYIILLFHFVLFDRIVIAKATWLVIIVEEDEEERKKKGITSLKMWITNSHVTFSLNIPYTLDTRVDNNFSTLCVSHFLYNNTIL